MGGRHSWNSWLLKEWRVVCSCIAAMLDWYIVDLGDTEGESQVSEEPMTSAQPDGKAPEARWSLWLSLGLYVLGVVTGVLLFALITMLNGGGLLGGERRVAGLDVASVRTAARDGTLDAIATLQAQSAQPEQPQVTPTPVPNTVFGVRDANRLGSADAPVVMIEYSDFQ